MPSAEVTIPDAVLDVDQLTFKGGVTAYLYRPKVCGFSLIGTVYLDSKNRFGNGRLIRTSDVFQFEDEQGFLIGVTIAGSRYVLIDPDDEVLSKPKEAP